MTGTFPSRSISAAFLVLAAATGAAAQGVPGPTVNPVCGRLEAQLAAIDRGAGDPARAEQARRLEDVLNRQQGDLDRLQTQWQRLGCQAPGLFSLFANQPPQCTALGNQIAQNRAGIDRTMSDLQRTRRGGDDEMQRQAVIGALAQNSCGPQYRVAAAPAPQRGFFETLFGIGGSPTAPPASPPPSVDYPQASGSYRTLCVRTCDGYYFPISYATSQSRFADDEQTCQKLCPAAETALYSQRTSGEDVSQAVAGNGRTYRELANAFRYRKEFIPSCSCRLPGQSWADALSPIKDAGAPGDIVVTEEKAKSLAQPRNDTPSWSDAANRTGSARGPAGTSQGQASTTASDTGTASADPQNRTMRTVGPTFIPPH